jgi:hypothetical protein
MLEHMANQLQYKVNFRFTSIYFGYHYTLTLYDGANGLSRILGRAIIDRKDQYFPEVVHSDN